MTELKELEKCKQVRFDRFESTWRDPFFDHSRLMFGLRLGLPDHVKFFQGHFFNEVRSVAWRGLVMPGTTAWLYAPLTNSSLSSGMAYGGQCNWIYAVCDIIFTFGVGLANFADTACILFYLHTLASPVIVQCVTVIHINWSALQVRRPEQNTAPNAKTEQFVAAKVSGNALKQRSRTHSVLRQSSSQLQNYKASHSKSAVRAKHTQRYDGAVHKFRKWLHECLVE